MAKIMELFYGELGQFQTAMEDEKWDLAVTGFHRLHPARRAIRMIAARLRASRPCLLRRLGGLGGHAMSPVLARSGVG